MQERRGIVPKKLNDKQVSELVIEHANGTSISALAKKYGIARNTVKAYISSNCNYGNFAIKKAQWVYRCESLDRFSRISSFPYATIGLHYYYISIFQKINIFLKKYQKAIHKALFFIVQA